MEYENTYKSSEDAIKDIEFELTKSKNLRKLLIASLKKAKQNAKKSLDDNLYQVLDELGGWPTNPKGYIKFLNSFRCWIPHQSKNKAWSDPKEGYSQEVYDRLCHFYYLIDQPVGPKDHKIIVQETKFFKKWLVDFANLWGDFLNTTMSFNESVLKSFENFSPLYRLEDSLVNGKPNAPSGWLTFNQFFARQINPGLRPIAGTGNNDIIVSPADCTFKAMYSIDKNSNVIENGKPCIVNVKKLHKIGNVKELLKGSPHADKFANGTFVHYFLGPYSYHRFHAPISGIVDECRPVNGQTFLEVNLVKGQFDAPDNAENGYQFNQARGVITINATDKKYGEKGIVAVVPIGMCQVSGVNMTAVPKKPIAKGEEFGYFLFGGSDIIMLFQEGMDVKISNDENYRYYGTDISKPANSPK